MFTRAIENRKFRPNDFAAVIVCSMVYEKWDECHDTVEVGSDLPTSHRLQAEFVGVMVAKAIVDGI